MFILHYLFLYSRDTIRANPAAVCGINQGVSMKQLQWRTDLRVSDMDTQTVDELNYIDGKCT